MKSVTIDTVINSLHQISANQGVPRVNVSRNVTQFSSARFGDFCCSLNIFHSHFPPTLDGLDEQLIEDVPRTPRVGVHIWVCHHKHPLSRYATISSESKTDPTEIYLNTRNPPPSRNPETPDRKCKHCPNHYSGLFRKCRKIQGGSNARTYESTTFNSGVE
ncbi:hypothetical protein ACTXT7_007481 [Hymenolepis weldensis]